MGKSWVVFANAFVLSIETIFIESLTVSLKIPPLVIAANSIPIAGGMLLFIIHFSLKKKITIFRSWKYLVPASIFIALGIIMWYDSVSRIGASKESTLTGPIEAIGVLLMAWYFLKERLSRLQLFGALIAILGFFAALGSEDFTDLSINWFDLGDIEATISALAFASAIIFLTKLTGIYSSIEVAGASLLISGLILAIFQWIYYPIIPSAGEWPFLLLYSLLPMIGAFLYAASLKKVGASITSTVASSANLITVCIQLILREFGFRVILPENIFLLALGGILAIIGISLIHLNSLASLGFYRWLVGKEKRDKRIDRDES